MRIGTEAARAGLVSQAALEAEGRAQGRASGLVGRGGGRRTRLEGGLGTALADMLASAKKLPWGSRLGECFLQ